MIVVIAFAVEACIGVIFWALFCTASDADRRQEPEDEDGKRHSGLLEED